jgi:hypothetical protein
MSTVGIMSAFSFSSIFDLAEFYGTALMVLESLMKCRSWCGIRTVVFTALFPEQFGLKRVKYARHLCFPRTFNSQRE